LEHVVSRTRATVAALLLSLSLLQPARAPADEPVFGYVYTTDLLPRGRLELEQWLTWRADKAVGAFDVVEGRSEFEYGVSDALQLSAYLDYEWSRAFHDNVIDGSTFQPESLAHLEVGADQHLNTTRFTGVSAEALYRLRSPYTDGLGVAVYLEPTVGPALRELETRLILQKNFIDDRLVLAFNLTAEPELREVPVDDPDAGPAAAGADSGHEWDHEIDVNVGLAGSYRFARSWFAGWELQHEREWAGLNPFDGARATNAAVYTGPALHYGGAHFFFTATALEQLPWARDYAHSAPGFVIGGRTYADDFERFRVRLKFGWYY
jgi:hypothetical protein